MSSDKEKREKLIQFLDRKAFDPILKTSADSFSSENQKKKFEDVRRSTENEKKRFHDNYRTAEDVKNNYLSDLSSHTAKKKNAELEDLGLPTLPQFKQEFTELCDKLGV